MCGHLDSFGCMFLWSIHQDYRGRLIYLSIQACTRFGFRFWAADVSVFGCRDWRLGLGLRGWCCFTGGSQSDRCLDCIITEQFKATPPDLPALYGEYQNGRKSGIERGRRPWHSNAPI